MLRRLSFVVVERGDGDGDGHESRTRNKETNQLNEFFQVVQTNHIQGSLLYAVLTLPFSPIFWAFLLACRLITSRWHMDHLSL